MNIGNILIALIVSLLALFWIALVLSLIRVEIVRGINEMLSHHYKLRTDYLKEFEKTANNQQPRRTGSSYN